MDSVKPPGTLVSTRTYPTTHWKPPKRKQQEGTDSAAALDAARRALTRPRRQKKRARKASVSGTPVAPIPLSGTPVAPTPLPPTPLLDDATPLQDDVASQRTPQQSSDEEGEHDGFGAAAVAPVAPVPLPGENENDDDDDDELFGDAVLSGDGDSDFGDEPVEPMPYGELGFSDDRSLDLVSQLLSQPRTEQVLERVRQSFQLPIPSGTPPSLISDDDANALLEEELRWDADTRHRLSPVRKFPSSAAAAVPLPSPTLFRWSHTEKGSGEAIGCFRIVKQDGALYALRARVLRECLQHVVSVLEQCCSRLQPGEVVPLDLLLQDFAVYKPVAVAQHKLVPMSIRMSSVPRAGFGLFAEKSIPANTRLCTFAQFASTTYEVVMTGPIEAWLPPQPTDWSVLYHCRKRFGKEATHQLAKYWTYRQSAHWNQFVDTQLQRTGRGWWATLGPQDATSTQPGPTKAQILATLEQVRNMVGFRPLPRFVSPFDQNGGGVAPPLTPVRLTRHPYVVEEPTKTQRTTQGGWRLSKSTTSPQTVRKKWYDPVGTVWGYMNQPEGDDPEARKARANVVTVCNTDSNGKQEVYWCARQHIPAGTELLWYYGDKYDMGDTSAPSAPPGAGAQASAAPNVPDARVEAPGDPQSYQPQISQIDSDFERELAHYLDQYLEDEQGPNAAAAAAAAAAPSAGDPSALLSRQLTTLLRF